jgi:predicted enzyme related to lactoylglutathione lyase
MDEVPSRPPTEPFSLNICDQAWMDAGLPADRLRDRRAKCVTGHRSRVCHFVIDCDDLDAGVRFWSAALDATDEPLAEQSRRVYRRLRLPDSEIRILLQRTDDAKTSKERMHLDLETDDVEAEVKRLEALGATRYDHQQERGYDFWVLRDPWANEFCVLQVNFPELLAQRRPWKI